MSALASTWGAGSGDAAAPGSRRKKVYEYLKAANELRQEYTSQWSTRRNGSNDDYYDTPGAFADVEIARSGDEEMVLFPSYARRLTEKKKGETLTRERRGSWQQTIDEYRGVSDEGDFPSAEDESDMENAMVDVDVRGWIYAPSREPMSRKHRLMITLARKMSGIPAPTDSASEAGRLNEKGEDEYVDKQMQNLVGTAEKDADTVWTSSSSAGRTQGTTGTAPLSKDELSMANAHLMERLRPFLTNPMAGIPVTVFYFNNDESQSRTLMTDESGHFNLRAALSFVPTHVRVLASEDLSAAKPIEIIEPVGVSLISDIDDTVKHSAIASGAKEMFQNTFVRELAELTVDGVSEWYTKLAEQGVEIHYVSNAPWQLYPLLERYFKLVGLPSGSFHLKQYTGMLQGMFEPTAERKRGSLEQILRDFPQRKFILVGDSGEADLEVYTDIVLANPARILGIFIRDITTPDEKPFFEKSFTHSEPTVMRSRSTPQLADQSDLAARPALPPRRPREASPAGKNDDTNSVAIGDLIDLRDDDEQSAPEVKSPQQRVPPAKPSKPSSLRSIAVADDATANTTNLSTQPRDMIRRKPAPPLPPRRPSGAKTDSLIDLEPSPPASRSGTESTIHDQSNAASTLKNAIGSVSSILPSPGDYLPSRNSPTQEAAGTQTPPLPARSKQPPPPPPPRRTNIPTSTETPNPRPADKPSYPAAAQAALQYATERLNLSHSPSDGLRQSASNQSLGRATPNSSSGFSEADMPPAPLPNKREEMWRRRWERASGILQKQGVMLGSWRVGSDVQPVCVWLVEEAYKEMQRV